jgi:hypothetical protein
MTKDKIDCIAAARLAGMHPQTLKTFYIRRGKLKAEKVLGIYSIDLRDLDEFILKYRKREFSQRGRPPYKHKEAVPCQP